MHIRHLEWIFSIDKVIPMDVLPVFFGYCYTVIYPGAFFTEATDFLVDPYYSVHVLLYLMIIVTCALILSRWSQRNKFEEHSSGSKYKTHIHS